jgi:DNA modification methylase
MQFNNVCQLDNLDILNRLSQSDTKFDLILTDPPYNVGKNFENDSDKQESEKYLSDMETRVKLLGSVLSEHGSVIWFCSYQWLREILNMFHGNLHYQRMLIWHYRNGLSRQTNSPVTEYEPFLWFTKHPDIYTYNRDDIRVPYKSERVKNPVYKKNKLGDKVAWNPDPRGAKRGDVWEYPVLSGALYRNERTEHPAQKPISLFSDIIKAFCPKDGEKYRGKVLDIYSGSGTTAVSCEYLNNLGNDIKWICCEIEKKWADISVERLYHVKCLKHQHSEFDMFPTL